METPEMVRIFIAIELPLEIKTLLTGLQEKLKASTRGRVSWTRPELMHLTVRFIGDIEKEQVSEVAEAIERAAKGIKSFKLTTTALGAFPDLNRPRLLWIGIDKSCELTTLSDRINAGLRESGFEEGKRFIAHLTICRIRERGRIKGLAKAAETTPSCSSESFEVKEIVLFKSNKTQTVGGTSPVHTALRRIALEQ